MAKKKYYVVWEGVEPGIYDNWTECQQQIKGFPNAKYKSFKSKSEAEEAWNSGYSAPIPKLSVPKIINNQHPDIIRSSWSVDAACSGNPGKMEYQGVHTADGSQIFHQSFPLGTNNIGELLAIVHALALLQKKGDETTPIYTDSRNAFAWLRTKKVKTTLKKTSRTADLFEVISRAEKWLKNNTWKNPILKWETKNWGEIPADFGRK